MSTNVFDRRKRRSHCFTRNFKWGAVILHHAFPSDREVVAFGIAVTQPLPLYLDSPLQTITIPTEIAPETFRWWHESGGMNDILCIFLKACAFGSKFSICLCSIPSKNHM